jgi:hypothetical protein
MADSTKGTDSFDCLEGTSDWYFVTEADCVDDIQCIDELFDDSTESNISNLLDDSDEVDQGNTLALFNEQLREDCDKTIQFLKRKYVSSPQADIAALSPKLQAISISPQKEKQSKRRLNFQDSGIEQDEAENTLTSQVEIALDNSNVSTPEENGVSGVEVLERTNQKAYMLFKFKETFGVSFNELVRSFRSDKSCNDNWVIAVFKAAEEVMEASKILIQKYCNHAQIIIREFNGVYNVQFKSAKSRETVSKLFCGLLNVQSFQMMCEPPKIRSVAAALWFYKQSLLEKSYMYGGLPQWILSQTIVDHQAAAAPDTFELSALVQWAYDNDITDEAEMAYEYAELASSDSNAAALLKHNNQVKFIRDACTMVRLYKRHEMRKMTMSDWIWHCSDKCEDVAGDWKPIMQLLKFQHVNILDFLYMFKQFLKGTPKSNCLVFYGPPDSGKSYFTYSLTKFLRGKVISYVNTKSQFFLQPLSDCKIGLLDDATYPCWTFFDINMRTALDGNYVSVDFKHKAPIQMKLPPLLVTTNYDVKSDQSLMYLHSRVQCICFPNKIPLTEQGNPIFEITDYTWKCFFRKLATQLELTIPEKEDGLVDRPFQCHPRQYLESN